jgi:hypothetical protein
MSRKWTIAVVTTVILSACSSPSIHPLCDHGRLRSLSGFLRKHAHDPGALSPPTVFRSVGHGPNNGRRMGAPRAEG